MQSPRRNYYAKTGDSNQAIPTAPVSMPKWTTAGPASGKAASSVAQYGKP